MQRTLAILAGASCGVFILGFVANVVAIRGGSPTAPTPVERRAPVTPGLLDTSAPDPASDPDPVRTEIRRGADELIADLAPSALGAGALAPLVTRDAAEGRIRSEFLLESPARGLWVTRTELRLPCEALDAALDRAEAPGLERPRHCERWVEAAALVLERHGLTDLSPREFLEQYAGDRGVRVLLVYAGWRRPASVDAGDVEQVTARAVPVHPPDAFGPAKRRAHEAVYASLELGPYHSEP